MAKLHFESLWHVSALKRSLSAFTCCWQTLHCLQCSISYCSSPASRLASGTVHVTHHSAALDV